MFPTNNRQALLDDGSDLMGFIRVRLQQSEVRCGGSNSDAKSLNYLLILPTSDLKVGGNCTLLLEKVVLMMDLWEKGGGKKTLQVNLIGLVDILPQNIQTLLPTF